MRLSVEMFIHIHRTVRSTITSHVKLFLFADCLRCLVPPSALTLNVSDYVSKSGSETFSQHFHFRFTRLYRLSTFSLLFCIIMTFICRWFTDIFFFPRVFFSLTILIFRACCLSFHFNYVNVYIFAFLTLSKWVNLCHN